MVLKTNEAALSPETGGENGWSLIAVIPAKAGIQYFQSLQKSWTPVFTGVTTKKISSTPRKGAGGIGLMARSNGG